MVDIYYKIMYNVQVIEINNTVTNSMPQGYC